MVIARDGRIFITEKQGIIRIIRDDVLIADPFLSLEVDDANERGLGHMVFHPDFERNGYYYIFYSVPGVRHNRISRLTANGDKTIPGSEHIIMELDQLGSDIHNGGDMVFGTDGYLYVGTGDGGQAWQGENIGTTNGKILRMDENGEAIPDNPWYTFPYLRARYVYAYGFRNPFTLTIHPLTGEIFANDVGGANFEEVNRIEHGSFYGWPTVEGKRTHQVVPPEYRDPVFQYSHANGYCAIVGSVFYTPAIQQFPSQYYGRYFYSDYCRGHIRMLDPNTWMDRGSLITDGDRIIDLDISADGSLYYLERKGLGDGSQEDNTSTNEGKLWRISYTGSGAPFISVAPQSVKIPVGENATFSVVAMGAQPLEYTWLVNGEEVMSLDDPILVLNQVQMSQHEATIQVEVSNAFGKTESVVVFLEVTDNQRPMPVITSPEPDGTYTAGETIYFSGYAEDPEEGLLSSAALSWRIDFHHGTHTHPAMSWTPGLAFGSWSIPVTGETASDVWYRVYLRATDQDGMTKTIHRDIYPLVGSILVQSAPSNLDIYLDGIPATTPYSIEGVRGVTRFLSPPYKQAQGDSLYFFNGWEDGSEVIHREVRTREQDQVFVGTFESILAGKGTGLTVSYYDNMAFEGDPVATEIDPVIDHQYLLREPYPGVPIDDFGIRWKGFIQPYRSGVYTFTVFADDGVFVEIDGHTVIQQWSPGVNYEKGTIYLEAGRLYPLHIRLYDWAWGSHISFRWSGVDFPEEVVPTSQLYPDHTLPDLRLSGILTLESLSDQHITIGTQSYRHTALEISITNALGQVLDIRGYWLPIGVHTLQIPIRSLPQGLYFLHGKDARTGAIEVIPFVKAK